MNIENDYKVGVLRIIKELDALTLNLMVFYGSILRIFTRKMM